MATALGNNVLRRFYEGTATVAQLDQALLRKWISQDEYNLAIAGEPPVGYVPPTALAAEAPADGPAPTV
jgi:hypothetical protein